MGGDVTNTANRNAGARTGPFRRRTSNPICKRLDEWKKVLRSFEELIRTAEPVLIRLVLIAAMILFMLSFLRRG